MNQAPSRASGHGPEAEAGFSLIELVVAMLLFVLLVSVMATYFSHAALSGQFGQHLTFATLVAQEQAEEIKTKTFSFVTSTNFTGSSAFSNAGITYTRTVTITPCTLTTTAPCPNPIITATSPNATLVTVTVTWQEPSTNSSKSYAITMAVHNYF